MDEESREKEEKPEEAAPVKPDDDESDEVKTRFFSAPRMWVTVVHAVFVGASVVMHFLYEWSDESIAMDWLANIDESVVQHLKMVFWPWLVFLCPLDIIVKTCKRQAEDGDQIWYIRKTQTTSWLTLWQSHLVSFILATLFIAGVFRVYTAAADVSHNLPADIITYMVAVILGPILRIWLFGRDQVVGWTLSVIVFCSLAFFFMYLSYEDNLHQDFWLDPHDSEDD